VISHRLLCGWLSSPFNPGGRKDTERYAGSKSRGNRRIIAEGKKTKKAGRRGYRRSSRRKARHRESGDDPTSRGIVLSNPLGERACGRNGG